MPQGWLAHTGFPLGGMRKSQAGEIAVEQNLIKERHIGSIYSQIYFSHIRQRGLTMVVCLREKKSLWRM